MTDEPPILFVNAHYYPDVAATAHHLTDLAEHMVAAGFPVEICTSRGRYVAGRMQAAAFEERNGVRITRVRSTSHGRGSTIGRLLDYSSFHLQALRAALGSRKYRGIIFLTTPPLLSFVGWLGRALRGRRYAIWSMDLHPEAEVAAGMLRATSLLGRLLFWANGRGYHGADFVIALGPYMRERILAGSGRVHPERVHVVPVWVDGSEIAPAPRAESSLARELGLEGRFVVASIGNAGLAHDFTDFLETMRELRDHPRIFFLFVGSGPQRARIEAFAATHGIKNFLYRDYYPRELINSVYGLADVHVVTLGAPFVGIAIPTKCYVSMATARPVLFVGPERSESADAIRDSSGGAVVDPAVSGASARIAALLRAWSDDPAQSAAMGARGRAYVLEHHDRDANCRAIESIIGERWTAGKHAAPRD
ncbi:MAG TPA: glycosyltransferase family 4 protein [Gemmatimonadaceae bacterium]|nr:glycosyltransferase family 4 protein [Gemmatimonadaceae bacterium]